MGVIVVFWLADVDTPTGARACVGGRLSKGISCRCRHLGYDDDVRCKSYYCGHGDRNDNPDNPAPRIMARRLLPWRWCRCPVNHLPRSWLLSHVITV